MQKKPATPNEITAVARLQSATGRSLRTAKSVTSKNIGQFKPKPETVDKTRDELQKMGFKIIVVGPHTISFSGPKDLFEKTFQAKLETKMQEVFKKGLKTRKAEYFAPTEPIKIPAKLSKLVESVSLPIPPTYFHSEVPPEPSYFHLDVLCDVPCLIRANLLHNVGIKGNGVKLAMIDTGFFEHAYYNGLGYNITRLAAVPGDDPADDDVGHGTGIAANALAVAPGADFLFIKYGDDPLTAFNLAVTENAQIISCSWGYPIDFGDWDDIEAVYGPDTVAYLRDLEYSIYDAVNNQSITVLFACGNGLRPFPANMPDVIAVGGVYINSYYGLRAASYASSFDSQMYPGRHCPDLCGLCGMKPYGIYIVMPTQPGSNCDDSFSNSEFPNGDETLPDDGWLVASGTSSATPMVAGVAALLLQARPGLRPATIKDILQRSARDVTSGQSSMGETAGIGWDNATGYGLVDAIGAYARLRWIICPPAGVAVKCPPAPVDIICPSGPTEVFECPSGAFHEICPPNPVITRLPYERERTETIAPEESGEFKPKIEEKSKREGK